MLRTGVLVYDRRPLSVGVRTAKLEDVETTCAPSIDTRTGDKYYLVAVSLWEKCPHVADPNLEKGKQSARRSVRSQQRKA